MAEAQPLADNFLKQAPYLQYLSVPPLLSSIQAGWNSINLEYHHQLSGEIPECYAQQHVLCIHTGGYQHRSQRWIGDRSDAKCMTQGDVFILPDKMAYTAQWDGAIEFIVLRLEPSLVSRVAGEIVAPDKIEILPSFPKSDPLIYQIGIALKSIIESDRVDSRLYAESMANALAVHLLQYYSVTKPILREYIGGLSQSKLRLLLDYIDSYIDRDLSIAELAALVQMSPHYFGRLFKRSLGLSPHQYVIQQRIERAKQLLLDRQFTIAEIAQSIGFAHQSHLNYHFKRLVGVTPKLFQK